MQEEINSKTVALYVKAGKMTVSVLQKAMAKYLQVQKQKVVMKKNAKKNELHLGKVSVKELAKQNAGMTNIEISPKNIKAFEKTARKYGVQFALKKDKTKEPPVYLVFFKGRDQDAITSAFREFSQKEIKLANRPSIHKRLAHFRDVVAAMNKDKSRHKHQNMER